LHAAVPVHDLVFEGEFEVADGPAFVDEEGVVLDLGLALGAGDPGDGAVLDAPEFEISFPAGEVCSVEKRKATSAFIWE
jgi:hypothetical protein